MIHLTLPLMMSMEGKYLSNDKLPREYEIELHDSMVKYVEDLARERDQHPKKSLWAWLPIRKGLAKLIPSRLYSWAWQREFDT